MKDVNARIDKSIIICMLLSFFVISCAENDRPNSYAKELKTLKGMQLSPLVDSLFQSFFDSEPKSSAYAIFIDKKSEGLSDYVITIAPISKKLNNLYESGATNYFLFNDSIPVFIYSGLEDFIKCDSSSYLIAKKISPDAKGEFKNIDFFNKFIDFSRGYSYVHYDTSTFSVKENGFPFANIKITRPTVFFDPNLLESKK